MDWGHKENFMKLSSVFPLFLEELTFFCYLVKFWVSLFVQWNCLHMDSLSSELLRWSNWLWEQEVIQDCSLTGSTICFWHKWRAAHGECIFCIPTDALRSSLEGMSAAWAWEMKKSKREMFTLHKETRQFPDKELWRTLFQWCYERHWCSRLSVHIGKGLSRSCWMNLLLMIWIFIWGKWEIFEEFPQLKEAPAQWRCILFENSRACEKTTILADYIFLPSCNFEVSV